MKCVIMPDLTACAEEFLEDGIITYERMRAVDANARPLRHPCSHFARTRC